MCKWKKIHKYTYWQIYDQFQDDLTVFATLTDMDGRYGRPTILTSWGFKNSDYPLIKTVRTKGDRSQEEWDWKYYIVGEIKKEEDD